MNSIIKVWKGRAYLHEEYEYMGLPCEKDTPLGNNVKLINKVRKELDCEIVFLNNDFTQESLSD